MRFKAFQMDSRGVLRDFTEFHGPSGLGVTDGYRGRDSRWLRRYSGEL